MKTIRARIGGIAPLLLLLLPVGLAWAGDKPTITIEVVDTRAWTKDVPIHHSGSSESSTDCNTNGTINDSNVSATTDLPPVSVHEIVRQSFSISTPAAVAGAVGKWETHGFAFSKLAVFWQASFP